MKGDHCERKAEQKKAKLIHDCLNVSKSLNDICLNHGQSIPQQMAPDNFNPVTNNITNNIQFSVLYRI